MKNVKCVNCGAIIEIDETKKSGICSHCKSAYFSDELINNYNNTNNITNNIFTQNVNMSKIEVDNLLENLRVSIKSSEYNQAYLLCNQILKIDNTISEVWYSKGISSGWSSTTQNIRLREVVSCFNMTYKLDCEKYNSDFLFSVYIGIAFALIKLAVEQISDFTNKNTINTLNNCLNEIKDALDLFDFELDVDNKKDFLDLIYFKFFDGCQIAYTNIKNEYGYVRSLMTSSAYDEYLNNSFEVENHLKKILYYENDNLNYKTYLLLIKINNELINSCSYVWFDGVYVEANKLSANSIIIRSNNIKIWKQKANEILSKIKQEKIDKYWEEHKEEKEIIENNIKNLQIKKVEIENKLKLSSIFNIKNQIKLRIEKYKLKKQLKELNNELTRER